jgi:hypothetical protein
MGAIKETSFILAPGNGFRKVRKSRISRGFGVAPWARSEENLTCCSSDDG